MRATPALGPAARRLLALGLAALACSCGRRERAAAPASPGGAASAATAAPPGSERPSFRAEADPDRPPFSGLRGARGAALDDRERLWVADFEHGAIRVFDRAGGFLGGWGSRGDGVHQLKDPCGIAIRGEDVYVADTWNGRVLRFSLSGEPKGRAPGDFYGPRGIAAAPDGKVWVADTGNGRVVVLESDLTNPKYLGKAGAGPEELASPVGIAAGPSGRVYVADTGNRRVQILDASGAFRSRFAFPGWGPNTEPYLAAAADESLYATDPASQSVVRLDRNGRETKRWTADDAGRKFSRPTGVALDAKRGVLYVVNTDTDVVATVKIPS